MVGLLANRGQFGLILPSTNTSVEAEFNRMLVPGEFQFEKLQVKDDSAKTCSIGVSWHSGRIFSAHPELVLLNLTRDQATPFKERNINLIM